MMEEDMALSNIALDLLGQARVLWEIGPDGRDVRDLRARLDLDSGYLSRLLRVLERDGLVEAVDEDGQSTYRITAAGRETVTDWFARPVERSARGWPVDSRTPIR